MDGDCAHHVAFHSCSPLIEGAWPKPPTIQPGKVYEALVSKILQKLQINHFLVFSVLQHLIARSKVAACPKTMFQIRYSLLPATRPACLPPPVSGRTSLCTGDITGIGGILAIGGAIMATPMIGAGTGMSGGRMDGVNTIGMTGINRRATRI